MRWAGRQWTWLCLGGLTCACGSGFEPAFTADALSGSYVAAPAAGELEPQAGSLAGLGYGAVDSSFTAATADAGLSNGAGAGAMTAGGTAGTEDDGPPSLSSDVNDTISASDTGNQGDPGTADPANTDTGTSDVGSMASPLTSSSDPGSDSPSGSDDATDSATTGADDSGSSASPAAPTDSTTSTTSIAAPTCQADSDGDGLSDCEDACPQDPWNSTRCGVLAASNVDLSELDADGAPAILLNCGVTTLDTSGSGSLDNACGTQPQLSVQGDLLALASSSFTVAAGSSLRVIGDRALAIVSAGTISIAGSLDASAADQEPGAGSDRRCDSARGSAGSGFLGLSGGGGGGFASAGGRGGKGTLADGGRGGSSFGTMLSPLSGGCPGGDGGACRDSGGGGGGAVQLAAANHIEVTGTLRSQGGDGEDSSSRCGAGGGGSGGAFLLEAPRIDLTRAFVDLQGGNGGRPRDNGRGRGANSARDDGRDGLGRSLGSGGGGGGGYGVLRTVAADTCLGCQD